MQYSKSNEITRVKQLIEDVKLIEALQLLDEVGKKKTLSYEEKISYYSS